MKFNSSDLEVFLEGADVFLAILDEKGLIKKVNDRWCSELNICLEDLVNSSFINYLHADDQEAFLILLEQIPEQKAISQQFTNFINDKQQYFSIQFDLNYNDGNIYLIGFDVTEQQKEHRSLLEMSELSNTGAWYHDPIRDKTSWSDEVYRIHDLPIGEPVNAEKALSFYSVDDQDTINECVEKLYLQHLEYDYSGEIVTAKGKTKWIRTQARPTIHNGEIIFIHGVTSDQTSLHKNLNKLNAYAVTQNLALKGIKSGLFDYNIINDTIFFSIDFRQMLGLPDDMTLVSNETFMNLVHPKDKKEAEDRLAQGLKSKSNHYHNGYRLKDKNGKFKHYEVHGWIKKNEKGESIRMVGNLIDVDEKVKIQRERVRITNSLEAMVDNGFMYSLLLDLEGKILLADERTNDIIRNDYSVDPKKVKVKYVDVMPNVFKQTFDVAFHKTLTGETVRKEVERPLLDGAMQWLEIMYRPIKNENDEIIFVLCNMMDFTERKKAELSSRASEEKSKSLNALKSNILANLSHELRTPLNGIMGVNDLLLKNVKDDEHKSLLNLQKESGLRLMKTLTEMIVLSDVDSFKQTMNMVSLDLNVLGQIVYDMYFHLANMKKLKFRLNKSEEAPIVSVDKEMILSVLGAVVNNALKYTDKGSVVLSCKVLKETKSIEFSVEDTGRGISPENQERIFEDFEQENLELSRKYEGSGIGLSISRKLLKLMGGELILESSTLKKGSIFTIKMPQI